ncbi:MAG TPA: chromosome segregation protein SMC, partial [Chthoniobacteraceae bacterium]|nr:chromosome segregation protein SMC [Chthoniobacteraceae bacterium]
KEVKRQIGSLQRQAGKARRYQVLLADLRMLETHAAKRQFDSLEEQRAAAAAEHAALSEKQLGAEQEIERQESEVAVQRAALEEMEQRLNTARQAVNDLRTRISNHENRILFNNERAAEFSQLTERYRLDVASAEEKFRIAETQLRDTDAELAQITEMLAAELRRMEEKQAANAALTAERQGAEQTIAAVVGDTGRIENKLSSLRGQIAGVMQQRDGAEARLSILSGELEQLTFAFAQFTDRLRDTQAELERALQDLESHASHVTQAESQLRTGQGALVEVDRELRDTQRLLAEKESKLEVLRALNEGGEGFSEGTQAILRGLDNPDFFKPAILGALAQFIEVAPEFVTAVEAALGANLQAIVMKDTMVAESVIKTLSAQKLGKAALALRELDGHFEDARNEQLSLPEGAIDWLINKIVVQPEVARLVERLINHAVLVPDLATALRIFPQRGSSIVTLNGEVLTANGLVHGGATSEAVNSVLQRKNQIHDLEGEAAVIRGQIDSLNERRAEVAQAIETTQSELEEAREEKQNATVLVSTLRGQLAMVDREAKDTERKHQNLEGERASSEARHQEAIHRVGSLEAEIVAGQEHLVTLQARRTEAVSALEALRLQEGEIAGELNELKIKVATERQRHSSLHHQRQPMEARISELRELIAQRQLDIESYGERAAAMKAENAGIEADLERLRGQVSEGESGVAALLEERTGIASAVEEVTNTLRILRHQLTECHDQRSRLEVKQSQFEMRAASIHEHIQKRYHLDLREFERDLHGLRVALREQAKRQQRVAAAAADGADATEESHSSQEAPPPPEGDAFAIDWERLDSMVKELDTRLDAMGPVNLDAIQEYDELEQRYTFLEQQNTDLTNSKAELLAVITKINQTTRSLFAETFEKIRVNFQEMFAELFGGGKANLVLTDESDPLESGIEIIAKPPGKQLTSISLLSGGEKTMTAVALLFSIYMVKPSPFCVLDEMDAPLDESNINRFIKILDRFVTQSQFVVISHNKRTIARADAIYGVTMEEHGVSKLVGVKFSTRERPANGETADVLSDSAAGHVPSVAETFGKTSNLASEEPFATEGAA